MAHLKKRHREVVKNLAAEIFTTCFCDFMKITDTGERRVSDKVPKGGQLEFGYISMDRAAEHSFVANVTQIKLTDRSNWFAVTVTGCGEGFSMFALEFEVCIDVKQLELDDTGDANASFLTWQCNEFYPYSNTPIITEHRYCVSLRPLVAKYVETIESPKEQELDEWIAYFTKHQELLS